MDPTKIVPMPPATNDVVAWIAVAMVACMIATMLWAVTRGIPRVLATFERALAAERTHDEERAKAIHARLDDIHETMTDVRVSVLRGDGCRATAAHGPGQPSPMP